MHRHLSEARSPLLPAFPATHPKAFGAARAGETIAATFAAAKVKDDVVKAVGLVSVFLLVWVADASVSVPLMWG